MFKLKWLLENSSEVKTAYEKGDLLVGTVDSWLLYKLSSERNHMTDVTNASRTFLMDLKSLSYSSEILDHFDLRPDIFPQIKPNVFDFGSIDFASLLQSPLLLDEDLKGKLASTGSPSSLLITESQVSSSR